MTKAAKKLSKKEYRAVFERQRIQKIAFLEKVEETHLIQVACQKVGISRATYYRWLEEDRGFAEKAKLAQFHGKEVVNDLAESKLITAIKNGERWAIEFWLRHQKDEYRFKPEVLKKIEDVFEEQRERKKIRLMIEEVAASFGNKPLRWQTQPKKTGFWDHRKESAFSKN